MNFQTILEELDRLYEEDIKDVDTDAENTEEVEMTAVAEACDEALTEADEEVLIDGEPIEDDEVEDAETAVTGQFVLECSNCGALVINAEADVTVDEETDLANIEVPCQYCEAKEGYKVIGTFTPYEDAEEEASVEESLTESAKTIRGYEKGNTEFSTKIAKELQAKFGGEIKKIKTDQGSEDIWVDTKNKAKAANKYVNKQYPDATFNYDEL